jgi:hypothetical protein
MQDEISKHSKKIYSTVKNHNQTLREKLKDIIIEIFIIVFAVSLSIWLHSWSETNGHQREVKEFLLDLKEDLSSDINSMQAAKTALSKNVENIVFLESLTKAKLDSLISNKNPFGFTSSIGTTKLSSANYEGFKSSGKIGFIEDKELKKQILKYYQDAAPSILEVERINATQVIKISDYWIENTEKDISKIILSPRFRSMLETFKSTSKSSLDLYQDGIGQATKIISGIDTGLK